MGETPSHRRRQGRDAFDPHADPMDLQPYRLRSWKFKMHLADWLDGWDEAKKEYEESQRVESIDQIHIIFDGPPGPESPGFVEVENDAGESISVGEWSKLPNDLWRLTIRKDIFC